MQIITTNWLVNTVAVVVAGLDGSLFSESLMFSNSISIPLYYAWWIPSVFEYASGRGHTFSSISIKVDTVYIAQGILFFVLFLGTEQARDIAMGPRSVMNHSKTQLHQPLFRMAAINRDLLKPHGSKISFNTRTHQSSIQPWTTVASAYSIYSGKNPLHCPSTIPEISPSWTMIFLADRSPCVNTSLGDSARIPGNSHFHSEIWPSQGTKCQTFFLIERPHEVKI